jgi:hypothetical protein
VGLGDKPSLPIKARAGVGLKMVDRPYFLSMVIFMLPRLDIPQSRDAKTFADALGHLMPENRWGTCERGFAG